VNGTRKQTKKGDTTKLTTLAFKMVPILHNTLLATPKIYFSGVFAHFWGSPSNQPTTMFMGPNSNFTMGKFVLLGRIPNSNFNPGAFAHFGGPLGHFAGQGPKIKFYSGGHFYFWGVYQTQVLLRGFCPFWGPTGAFWGSFFSWYHSPNFLDTPCI
jgi:hypothetical protein